MNGPDPVMTDERLEALERWKDEFEGKFKSAFASGDHEGHRQYHEMMMEAQRDRKRLIAAVKEKTISGLIWAGVVMVGLALWQWIKTQVKG